MTIHMTFDELRSAQPDLPIDIIQRLGHEAGGIKPLICDGIAGPRTKSGIYLDPSSVAQDTPASIALWDKFVTP